jgi:hypothetical protein
MVVVQMAQAGRRWILRKRVSYRKGNDGKLSALPVKLERNGSSVLPSGIPRILLKEDTLELRGDRRMRPEMQRSAKRVAAVVE